MQIADRNMISDVVDTLQARSQRRRWSDEVKAKIVAESCAPGAVVSEVARRHEILPQHLSAWRKAARSGLLKLPNGAKLVVTTTSGTTEIEDRSSSSGAALGLLGAPLPGHEFIKTRGRPEIDQLGENVGQVGLRLDAAKLASFDERSDTGPVLRALIMPRKKRVLSIENKRTDTPFDDVRVCALTRCTVLPGENPGRQTLAPAGSTRRNVSTILRQSRFVFRLVRLSGELVD
jgi:transposase